MRLFCSACGDGLASVRGSDDNWIVVTAALSGDDPVAASIAVGPEGNCACRTSAGDTHLASAAPDARSFDSFTGGSLHSMACTASSAAAIPTQRDAARPSEREGIRRVERELMPVMQEGSAPGYGRGYDDAAAGLASRAPSNRGRVTDRGPGDAAQNRLDDATAKGYLRGYDERTGGASRADAAVRRHQVSYFTEVTAVDHRAQAELHSPGGAWRLAVRSGRHAQSQACAPHHRLRTTRRCAASSGRRGCSAGCRWEAASGTSGQAADGWRL